MKLIMAMMICAFSVGCSNADKCETKKQGSFASFLDDEWRTYCNEYESHITTPLDYELIDLAHFFAQHEDKVGSMRESMVRFDDVESCFDTSQKILEYRELDACLTYDERQDVEMTNAFSTALEPWVEDLSSRVGAVNPKLNRAERESKRLINRSSSALDQHQKFDDEGLEIHIENIKELKTKITKARAEAKLYGEIKETLVPNGTLSEKLESDWSDEVDSFLVKLKAQEKRILEMEDLSKTVLVIKNTAGKSCPRMGRNHRKETKLAIRQFGSYFRKIESGRIRIRGRIRTENEEGLKTQSFSGFVCGLRLSVEDSAKLCTVHRFELKRVKDKGRWTKWEGEPKEGALKDGVDCSKTD